jgi:hypothetical protein
MGKFFTFLSFSALFSILIVGCTKAKDKEAGADGTATSSGTPELTPAEVEHAAKVALSYVQGLMVNDQTALT